MRNNLLLNWVNFIIFGTKLELNLYLAQMKCDNIFSKDTFYNH